MLRIFHRSKMKDLSSLCHLIWLKTLDKTILIIWQSTTLQVHRTWDQEKAVISSNLPQDNFRTFQGSFKKFMIKKIPNKSQFYKLQKTTSSVCLKEFFKTIDQPILKTLFLSFINLSYSNERKATNWYNVDIKLHQQSNWFERIFKQQLCLTCLQNIVVQSLKWWKVMELSLMGTTQPIKIHSKSSKYQVAMWMINKNIFPNNEVRINLFAMIKLLKTFVLTTTKLLSCQVTTPHLKIFVILLTQSIYCLKIHLQTP